MLSRELGLTLHQLLANTNTEELNLWRGLWMLEHREKRIGQLAADARLGAEEIKRKLRNG